MSRRRDCFAKVQFPKKKTADKAARGIEWRTKLIENTIVPYLCKCGSWHLGRPQQQPKTDSK